MIVKFVKRFFQLKLNLLFISISIFWYQQLNCTQFHPRSFPIFKEQETGFAKQGHPIESRLSLFFLGLPYNKKKCLTSEKEL